MFHLTQYQLCLVSLREPHIIKIFINDVIENIKHGKIWLFADDIVLHKEISAVKDAQQLQEDLESLQLWEGT